MGFCVLLVSQAPRDDVRARHLSAQRADNYTQQQCDWKEKKKKKGLKTKDNKSVCWNKKKKRSEK
jgi:hypothetical protein